MAEQPRLGRVSDLASPAGYDNKSKPARGRRLTWSGFQAPEEFDDEGNKLSFQIHLDGKWLVYGPLITTLLLDLHTRRLSLNFIKRCKQHHRIQIALYAHIIAQPIPGHTP